MYNQIRGTAMGTKCAPTYATLVLAYLGEILYSETEINYGKDFSNYIKESWKRFFDDCFIFWIKGKDELNKFHSMLNKIHPDLKFTIEYSEENLSFLDILFIQM